MPMPNTVRVSSPGRMTRRTIVRRAIAAVAVAASVCVGPLTTRAQTAPPAPAAAPAAQPSAPAADATPRNTIVVFDGSGSMWGRIDGDRQARFVVVREALRKSLAAPPAGTRLGMLSFGYRRQADCSDVGVLAPLDTLTAENMTERIMAPLEKINPKGKGPLTAAIREAARTIGRTAGPRSLVVVHDGLDNCGLNPCDAVNEVREAAPGVAIHVLAIGLDEEDAKKYQCLATATGGTHHEARSAPDVAPAIEAMTRLALGTAPAAPAAAAPQRDAAPAAAAPAPVDLARDGPPHLRLRALMTAGKPFPPGHRLRWHIRPERADAAVVPIAADAQDALVPVAAGRLVVTLEDGLARAETIVTAPEKGHLLVEVPLEAGIVRLGSTEDAATFLTVYERASAEGQPASASVVPGRVVGLLPAVPAAVTLPAGSYLLRTERGNRRTDTPVTVAAAQVQSLPLPKRAIVEVTLADRIAADGKDRNAGRPAILSIEEDDPLSPRGRREIARSAATPAVFTLPPGTYTLVASQGPLEVRERIAVTAGERIRRTIPLATSRLILAMRALGGEPLARDGRPVWFAVERRDVTGGEPRYVFERDPVIDVPPGRYAVTGHFGTASGPVAAEVDVAAGETRAVVLTPQLGTLVMRPGAKLSGEVSWQLTDQAGRRQWLTGSGPISVNLPPGRYDLRASARGQEAEGRIEIGQGERREATIGD